MLHFLFQYTPLYLMTQSFWRDEAFSYVVARNDLMQITTITAHDFNPPLYYYILHFWMNIFGHSEITIRSLSLIFFAVTIYVAYLFLKNIFKITGIERGIYMLMFTFNPYLLYYAFEGRMYAMLACISILSYYFFLQKNAKGYFLSLFLGLFTHYFFVFIFLSQIVYSIITRREFFKKNLIYFISLIPYVAWIIYIAPNFFKQSGQFWMLKINLGDIASLPGSLFTGHEQYDNFYTGQIMIVSLFIFCTIIYFLMRKKSEISNYLALASFLPFFAIALISMIKPIFVIRYVIFCSVSFNLFLYYHLHNLKKSSRIIMTCILIGITIQYLTYQTMFKRKGDIRGTISQIKQIASQGDDLFVTDAGNYFVGVYYFNENNVYVYENKNAIPPYVGIAAIPDNKITKRLPLYPNKAFILKNDTDYDIITSL